jgi:hypothetical protein
MEWQILIGLVGVLAVVSIYYWGARKLEKDPAQLQAK